MAVVVSPLSLLALKTLFIVLTCTMAATLAYGLAIDGYSSCLDPSARWTQVIVADVLIFMSLVVTWFFYKESSWIKRVFFIVVLFWCGSFVTCGYIAMQFFKLSPEESSNDLFYFLLGGHLKGDVIGQKRRPSVVTTRVIVGTLGCFMVGILVYALIVDGFPFHAEVFTSCMTVSTIDDYIHTVVFSLWIAYKESNKANAFLWILSLLFFRSIAICVYILRQLFYLSRDQSVYLILFKESNRDMTSDPLLLQHASV